MQKCYPIFVVNEPFCMINQSATLVDHLLVTPNLSVLQSVQSLGVSDHRCQIVDVDTPVIATAFEIYSCQFGCFVPALGMKSESVYIVPHGRL